MKKLRLILLTLVPALVLMVSACADDEGNSNNSVADDTVGYRVVDGVWEIYNENGLIALRDNLTQDVKLVNNIDLKGSENNQWTPIGDNINHYSGTFDGDNYTISGLYINDNISSDQGLFGSIDDNGTVKNLKLKNVEITAKYRVGALVGENFGNIINVHVDYVTINAYDYIGAIASGNGKYIYASSASNINITARNDDAFVGGITGYSNGNIVATYVDNLSLNGIAAYMGGIVGLSHSGHIVSSYTNDVILTNTGGGTNVGGIVGFDNGVTLSSNYFVSDDTSLYGVGSSSSDINATRLTSIQSLNDNLTVINIGIDKWVDNGNADFGFRYEAGENSNAPKLVPLISSPLQSLTLSYPATMYDRGTAIPTLTYEPFNTNERGVIFTIDNTSYASIDADTGVVTAISAGTVKVTVTSNVDNTKTAEFSININPDPRCALTDMIGYTDNATTNVWEIYNKHGLANLGTAVTSGNGDIDVKLVCDIDLEGGNSNQWTPIGDYDNDVLYSGTFDGDNYTISNLFIDDDTLDDQALFSVNTGAIKNLKLKDFNITAGAGVAALVSQNSGSVENVSVIGGSVTGTSVDGSFGFVGGIVGANNGNILSSYNSSVVTGTIAVGGITGYNIGVIGLCYNTGDVTGDNGTGGIVGYNNRSLIIPQGIPTVVGSYNTGHIAGDNGTGGIVGFDRVGVAAVYNTGDVTGDNMTGGIAGNSIASISNGYNTGNASGTSNTGAIIGLSDNATIDAMYYLQTSTVNDGLTGINDNSGAVTDNTSIIQSVDSLTGFKVDAILDDLNDLSSLNGPSDSGIFYINGLADNPPLLIDGAYLLSP